MRVALVLVTALLVLGSSHDARADDRPYVFVQDAVGPGGREIEGVYSLMVGANTSGALRLADPTIAHSGIVQQIGAQVGLAPWFSFGAFGLLANGPDTASSQGTGGGYLHFTALRPKDPRLGGVTLGFDLFVVREFQGVMSMSLYTDVGYTKGLFNLMGNVQLERRMASTADPLDVLVRLGFNFDVLDGRPNALRLGFEYVGQDLEELVQPEADGGAVHLVAASLTASLVDHRLQIGAAPGVMVSPRGVGFGSRLLVAYRF